MLMSKINKRKFILKGLSLPEELDKEWKRLAAEYFDDGILAFKERLKGKTHLFKFTNCRCLKENGEYIIKIIFEAKLIKEDRKIKVENKFNFNLERMNYYESKALKLVEDLRKDYDKLTKIDK